MQIKPIAYIKTDFKEKFGIPRQSGRSPSSIGKIFFQKEFNSLDAIRGIEEFTHIWLIFGFSKNMYDKFSPTVRPPRLGGNQRVGVFASRSPYRPNMLGLSSVKLIKVKNENGIISLIVSGVDLLDGTPIYDIKPYIFQTDCHTDAKSGYSDENWGHSLKVNFRKEMLDLIEIEKQKSLIECLSDDPRPSYHLDDRTYHMLFADYDISFIVKEQELTVTEVKKSKKESLI